METLDVVLEMLPEPEPLTNPEREETDPGTCPEPGLALLKPAALLLESGIAILCDVPTPPTPLPLPEGRQKKTLMIRQVAPI